MCGRWKSLIFSSLIVLIFIGLSLVPGAAESDGAGSTVEGDCGSGTSFVFDRDTGELVISGDGSVTRTSWNSMDIRSVVIGPDVAEIGDRVFEGMTSIQKLSMPGSTDVGRYAFAGCSNMTADSITAGFIDENAFRDCKAFSPQSITASTIAKKAFLGCEGLQTLKLTVFTKLNESAFENCTKLKYVEISAPVIDGAFKGCSSLEEIYIWSGSVKDYGFNGCTTVKTIFVGGEAVLSKQSLAGLTGVTSVGYNCRTPLSFSPFNAEGFTSNVESCTVNVYSRDVPANLFSDVRNIDRVCLKEQVTGISPSAFLGDTSITEIVFECKKFKAVQASPFIGLQNAFSMEFDCDRIPANILNGCSNVRIVKTVNDAMVISVGDHAFSGTSADITLKLAKPSWGVKSEIGESAFSSTGGNVTVSSERDSRHVLYIHGSAFENSRAVLDLSGIQFYTVIEERAFHNSTVTSVPGASVKSIGDYAFGNCVRLTDAVLDKNVTSLGHHIFDGCSSIRDVRFGAVDAMIAEDAFTGMGTQAVFSFTDDLTSVPASLFKDAGVSVRLNPNMVSIGDHAFSSCTVVGQGMGDVPGIRIIGDHAFADCRFEDSDFSACDSITSIGAGAFAGSDITDIRIPVSVTYLASDAFAGCSNVRSIEIGSTQVSYIDKKWNSVFAEVGSSDLPLELSFFGGITDVPKYGFRGMSYLKTVDLTPITEIAEYGFMDTGLTKVLFPETLVSIGDCAFQGSNHLRDLTFRNPDVPIGTHAFLSNTAHLDTHVHCQRHSTAAEYPWQDDRRDENIDYSHVAGEYDGMMEVIFNMFSAVLGADIANAIIDFLFDNIALNIMESIDLGSVEKNEMLLVGIALALLILLFAFLYFDASEGVRIMEIVLSMFVVVVLVVNTVRLLLQYPDWYSVVSIWVVGGVLIPLIAGVHQIRSRRQPYEGETLIRLYSLDNQAIKDIFMQPWDIIRGLVTGRTDDPYFQKMNRVLRIPMLIIAVPLGAVLSVFFSVSFILFHLPAYVFSRILASIFTAHDRNTGKHTDSCVCPYCGSSFPKVYYVCNHKGRDGTVCRTVHTDLSSGKYGVHKAICGTCGGKIKCNYRGPRWADSIPICPKCHRTIDIREAEPFPVSMIGNVGSGKTSLAATAMRYVRDSCGSAEPVFISNDKSGVTDTGRIEQVMDLSARPAAEGGPMVPTRSDREDIFTCLMKDSKGPVRGLYVYDVSGRYYTDFGIDVLERAKEYVHSEGFVMVVNPYDLRLFCMDHGVMYSDVDEVTVFSSFMNKYISQVGNPDRKKPFPFAVVVSRASEAGLRPSTMSDVADESGDEAVKRFLKDNELTAFVNIVESKFEKVRYFAFDGYNNGSSESAAVPYAWIMHVRNKGSDSIFE